MHVDSPPVQLIKIKNDAKLDNYFVKIKLCGDLTLEKLDLYEFKMDLFDDGKPEEFLLLIRNFNMTGEVSGTIKPGAMIQ